MLAARVRERASGLERLSLISRLRRVAPSSANGAVLALDGQRCDVRERALRCRRAIAAVQRLRATQVGEQRPRSTERRRLVDHPERAEVLNARQVPAKRGPAAGLVEVARRAACRTVERATERVLDRIVGTPVGAPVGDQRLGGSQTIEYGIERLDVAFEQPQVAGRES